MNLQNVNTSSSSIRQLFLYRVPPVPNEMQSQSSLSCEREITNPSFIPLDSYPQTQLIRFLRSTNIIDAKWNPTPEKVISFSLDTLQEQWIEKLLQVEISVKYENTNCTFKVSELFEHISEKCPVKITRISLIGGITRFLIRASPQFCTSVFEQLGVKIDLLFLQSILQDRLEYLPDIDIRFELDFVEPKKRQEILDQCRFIVIDFIRSKLEKKSNSYIPNKQVEQKSLLKNKTFLQENISYSIIACGRNDLGFSKSPPSVECLFVLDLGKTPYLSSRDNLQISLKKNTKHAFSSYGNQQLKAILHILLGKIGSVTSFL